MHGLIFATWERFLNEEYGEVLLGVYKAAIETTDARYPLVSRSYDDAILLQGVAAISKMTGVEAGEFLEGYGRYFITNSLTNHICAHILDHVHSARDLLLAMRSVHRQLHTASSEVTPPVFSYTPLPGDGIRISYDSHRQLCPILVGAIKGAAQRYGEVIAVKPVACMKDGASECLFDLHFYGKTTGVPIHENTSKYADVQQRIKEMLFHMLPEQGRGISLYEVSTLVAMTYGISLRPSRIASLIMQMQNVGLVILSAKQEGDLYYEREYLRVSKCETEAGRLLVMNVS